MADSDALRMRRSRRHKAGDHSLCKRCAGMRSDAGQPERPSPERAVSDPRAELRSLAGLLAQAYRADPGNALLARELRMTLQAILGAQDGGRGMDGDLADLFAELGAS